jgi:hypothetical protein
VKLVGYMHVSGKPGSNGSEKQAPGKVECGENFFLNNIPFLGCGVDRWHDFLLRNARTLKSAFKGTRKYS